jgi:hypothetical protein
MPLRGGEAEQSDGLCSVLRNTMAVVKHPAQAVLSDFMPLCRCKAVESHSFGIVLRNTLAVLQHEAQVVLSGCMPLLRCKTVEIYILGWFFTVLEILHRTDPSAAQLYSLTSGARNSLLRPFPQAFTSQQPCHRCFSFVSVDEGAKCGRSPR